MQTKEQKAAYKKVWREANREKIAMNDKVYRDANREKYAAYLKAYQAANRERIAAHKKVWHEANREKILARKKSYDAARPNEMLARYHISRAKKAGVKTVSPKAILAWMKSWRTEAPVACHYCKSLSSGAEMTMDHVVPMSAGGPHDLSNLVVCCVTCNCSKQDKLPEEWQKQN